MSYDVAAYFYSMYVECWSWMSLIEMLIVLDYMLMRRKCKKNQFAQHGVVSRASVAFRGAFSCAWRQWALCNQERSVTMNMMLERAGCPEPGEQLVTMTKISGESKLTKQMLWWSKYYASESKSKEYCVSYSNGDAERSSRRAARTKGNAWRQVTIHVCSSLQLSAHKVAISWPNWQQHVTTTI